MSDNYDLDKNKKYTEKLRALQRELEKEDIFFSTVDELPDKCREWAEGYFHQTIYPVITPLAVDSSHPFPFLLNRSLNLAVELKRDRGGTKTAVIQVPSVLPRIVAPLSRCSVTLLFRWRLPHR